MIDGVKVTPLKQILDERGKIMHMMRSDAPDFEKFGEHIFHIHIIIKVHEYFHQKDCQLL